MRVFLSARFDILGNPKDRTEGRPGKRVSRTTSVPASFVLSLSIVKSGTSSEDRGFGEDRDFTPRDFTDAT